MGKPCLSALPRFCLSDLSFNFLGLLKYLLCTYKAFFLDMTTYKIINAVKVHNDSASELNLTQFMPAGQNVEKKLPKTLFGYTHFRYFQFRDRNCHPCLHTDSLIQPTREKVWRI